MVENFNVEDTETNDAEKVGDENSEVHTEGVSEQDVQEVLTQYGAEGDTASVEGGDAETKDDAAEENELEKE